MPAEGLRTQVIAATGSGKTLIATEAAHRLAARRVLVLVPTLDLLTQTTAAWREDGRTGAMLGACSLRAEDSDGVPCTTDPDELAAWVQGLERVTVFATYASVGLGILQRAHAQGLGVWDLMVVDEAYQAAGPGADAVRGARLAALQAGVLTAAAQEGLRKMLAFHSKVSEAEAMAESVADAARRLWEDDPRWFPAPERVWAGWLRGEHSPGHRRAVLDEFACDVIEVHDDGDGLGLRPAALRSVKVLGEGVDTANCDSVAFCDARGSMIDIVQMVGRALRMKSGEGKIASLIVPVPRTG